MENLNQPAQGGPEQSGNQGYNLEQNKEDGINDKNAENTIKEFNVRKIIFSVFASLSAVVYLPYLFNLNLFYLLTEESEALYMGAMYAPYIALLVLVAMVFVFLISYLISFYIINRISKKIIINIFLSLSIILFFGYFAYNIYDRDTSIEKISNSIVGYYDCQTSCPFVPFSKDTSTAGSIYNKNKATTIQPECESYCRVRYLEGQTNSEYRSIFYDESVEDCYDLTTEFEVKNCMNEFLNNYSEYRNNTVADFKTIGLSIDSLVCEDNKIDITVSKTRCETGVWEEDYVKNNGAYSVLSFVLTDKTQKTLSFENFKMFPENSCGSHTYTISLEPGIHNTPDGGSRYEISSKEGNWRYVNKPVKKAEVLVNNIVRDSLGCNYK